MQNCSESEPNPRSTSSGSDLQALNLLQRLVLGILGLLLLAAIGYLTVTLKQIVDQKGGRAILRQREAAMDQQIQELQERKIDCLVNPDPAFLDELFSDAGCVENLTTLYLGSEVSDPRLARLRDSPNLKSLIFYWSEDPGVFLGHFRGMTSIEEVSLDRSYVSREGIEDLASLPKLKSLCLSMRGLDASDFESLKGHSSIENLFLTEAKCDERLIPILQSLPRLKNVTIELRDGETAKELEKSLSLALPDCECSVQSWGR
ncbi:MAG: hypothetical protein JXM70_21125 [Pirellulales bacterium]|nr:hypothetical protein [Pirellulales bacterium]